MQRCATRTIARTMHARRQTVSIEDPSSQADDEITADPYRFSRCTRVGAPRIARSALGPRWAAQCAVNFDASF